MKNISTNHGKIKLPAFFPDATIGAVRGVEAKDVKKCRVDGLVVNAYHLLTNGLVKTIKKMGSMHQFMNWNGPLISDSGGFQIMSLIHEHPSWGKISKDKITFFSPQQKRKIVFTPEKSIQVQLDLGTDILMVLDDCTKPDQPFKEQEKSVERTILWAKKCKEYFEKATKNKSLKYRKKTLLFAIVQGGNNKKLRKHCAQELLKIGFDGYSYGGWPIQNGKLLHHILKYTAELLPDNKPKYAMGIGKPQDIIDCVKMGYDLFDCVIPTREARHGRLYFFTKPMEQINFNRKNFYGYLAINKKVFASVRRPISSFCDCFTCRHYSRAYLHNLLKTGDSLFIRLATIHNLRFYSELMNRLKNQ